jgi:hypothetical protein
MYKNDYEKRDWEHGKADMAPVSKMIRYLILTCVL